MSRILLAWELGAGFGHVALLRELACALSDLGQQCLFAVQDLAAAEAFALPALGPVFQAPKLPRTPPRPVRVQVSYASLLHNVGLGDADSAAAALRAWAALLSNLRIDALVAEHAPTALLAARRAGVPQAQVGSSFTVPPPQAPFPSFQPELHFDPAVLTRNEAAVLAALNRALAALGAEPLPTLQALFDGADSAVFGYPELDPYGVGAHPASWYRGLPDHSRGEPPRWPGGSAPRVFAYLRPSPQLPALLQALQESRVNALVRVAEVDPAALAPYARQGLRLVTGAVHLRQAAADCDAMLHYAPAGTTAEMLLAGKPGLLLPTDVEKGLVARQAAALGAALAVRPDAEGNHFRDLLERLVEDPTLRQSAEAFARRHGDQDRGTIAASFARDFAKRLQ